MRSLKICRMIVEDGLSEYDMTQIRLRHSRLLPWSAEVIVSDSGVNIRGMGGMIVLHGPSIDYYSDDPKDLSWLVGDYSDKVRESIMDMIKI